MPHVLKQLDAIKAHARASERRILWVMSGSLALVRPSIIDNFARGLRQAHPRFTKVHQGATDRFRYRHRPTTSGRKLGGICDTLAPLREIWARFASICSTSTSVRICWPWRGIKALRNLRASRPGVEAGPLRNSSVLHSRGLGCRHSFHQLGRIQAHEASSHFQLVPQGWKEKTPGGTGGSAWRKRVAGGRQSRCHVMRSNYINCKQLLLLGVSLRCAAGRALVLRIELRLRGSRPLRASIPDASVTARPSLRAAACRGCALPAAAGAGVLAYQFPTAAREAPRSHELDDHLAKQIGRKLVVIGVLRFLEAEDAIAFEPVRRTLRNGRRRCRARTGPWPSSC